MNPLGQCIKSLFPRDKGGINDIDRLIIRFHQPLIIWRKVYDSQRFHDWIDLSLGVEVDR